MGGGGSTYDYGFRIYNPQIAKFLSVDPLAKGFPMLTPYQYASNTPVWAIDLDGLEALIYTDRSAVPHSFLAVVDDSDVLHVYTFGQYGVGLAEGESSMYNEGGALVHLVGSAANEYVHHEFEMYQDKMRVFFVGEELVDKYAIFEYFLKEMRGRDIATGWRSELKLAEKYADNGSKAVKYKPYWLTPVGDGNENCSSVVMDACKAGGFPIPTSAIPWSIDNYLNKLSFKSDFVYDVTSHEKENIIDFYIANIFILFRL